MPRQGQRGVRIRKLEATRGQRGVRRVTRNATLAQRAVRRLKLDAVQAPANPIPVRGLHPIPHALTGSG
ncbi:hypothetical protein GGR23_004570 [Gellertiella hungarica]|uniref:Uncharacterized protein n=1 Tax=Gellertiella hungarica TaxID=1572859 RepID=A0A7W6J9L9_9HYPH|nr:hypothetical protein [Gellertiella hungarica]